MSLDKYVDELGKRLDVSASVVDDYEAQVEDLTQRLNVTAADLLETRSQRAHLARQLAVAAEQAIEHTKRHAEIFDELVRERDQLRARNHALVAWYTSELERLRTIIGELGAAEAAEPPPDLEQVVDEQIEALRPACTFLEHGGCPGECSRERGCHLQAGGPS